jgi:hypothetical protein
MDTERELAHELREHCRELLRYDRVNSMRVREAIDSIRDTLGEWEELEKSGELDRPLTANRED